MNLRLPDTTVSHACALAVMVSVAVVTLADADQDVQTTPAPDSSSDTSGPSDTTGYYLLGAIPLIVGVGGVIGIDHRLPNDDAGIWKRSHQLYLEYGVVFTEVGGAL